jgi:hypothetical protein
MFSFYLSVSPAGTSVQYKENLEKSIIHTSKNLGKQEDSPHKKRRKIFLIKKMKKVPQVWFGINCTIMYIRNKRDRVTRFFIHVFFF